MYDPTWPHGHTWKGTPCRVLADNIVRTIDNYILAVALPNPGGNSEYVAQACPEDLMPAPAPKKRIQGWIRIGRHGYHKAICSVLYDTEEEARRGISSDTIGIIYINAEEGEGLT